MAVEGPLTRYAKSPVIQVSDLCISFDGKGIVLDGISFDVRQGETLVIMGSSGGGKSTILRLLIRNLQPDSGTIKMFGQDIQALTDQAMDSFRRRFGIAFQFGALYQSMNVAENIALPIVEHYPETPREVVDIIVKIKLNQVGLNGCGALKPAEISGGMRKRVAFARAAALDPEILFYDEPTAGLDPITASVISELIINFSRKLDVTTVVVTHDMASAFRIADRIIMLHDGRILAKGTPDEIREHPSEVVQQFIQGRPGGPITLRTEGPDLTTEILGESVMSVAGGEYS